VGAHFGGGSNRFYPALHRAGITDRRIDASGGMRPDDRAHLLDRGVGITSLVAGASARADELTPAQLRAGAAALASRLAARAPAVVAVLGVTAYRVAFEEPGAVLGAQARDLAGAALWVVPNPSGLNRHASLDDLASAYRDAAVAAGIEPFATPA
jgi:TDG/mug DNA glycosylase family protein